MTDAVDNDEQIKYKALLESTKAIPWKLDWVTKQFTYIGPQIEELLGGLNQAGCMLVIG